MLEYSEAEDNVIKEEVHNCDLRQHFTNSILSMRDHVRLHQFPRKIFNCAENASEIYQCKECDFKTDFLVFFKKHVEQIHLIGSENVEYTLQSFICRNCTFKTYSSLHWLHHFIIGCHLAEEMQHEDADDTNIPCVNSPIRHSEWKDNLFHCDKCSKHELCKHKPDDKIKWFKCDHCEYKAKLKANLKRHVRLRHTEWKDNSFQCDKCSKHELCKHKSDDEITYLKCDHCEYKTKLKHILKSHVLRKHCERKDNLFRRDRSSKYERCKRKHKPDDQITWFKCDHCEYKAKLRANLKRHVLTRHTEFKDNLFHCDKCSKQELCKHKLDDQINWFKCDHCEYKSKFKADLGRHVHRKHSECEDKPHYQINWFKCDHCEYKSKVKEDLRRHGLTKHSECKDKPHYQINWFKCDHCKYKSKFKWDLRTHVLGQHSERKANLFLSKHELCKHKPDDQINWLKCYHCEYKAKLKGNLKRHVLTRHTEFKDNLFQCGECSKHELCKHKPDDQINWFKCDHCEYKAKLKEHLNLHVLRKHSEWKDNLFHCDMCSFMAEKQHTLKNHVKKVHLTPEEIEWFQCDKCSFKTNNKRYLREHNVCLHLESEETQWFQCDKCPYKAKLKSNLKQHNIRLHLAPEEIEWLQCNKCSYKAKLRGDLTLHNIRNHSECTK